MPSTESQLSAIVDTLNRVRTAAQARSAIGSALVSLHETYPIKDMIGDDSRKRAAQNELDQARIALEQWYRRIVPTGNEDFSHEWAKQRHLVNRAYVVISGVEGTAGYTPRTSNWEILRESVSEGMGTVTSVVTGAAETAGLVVGSAAGAAGKGVGSAVGGIFSGLGIGGTLYLVLIGGAVLLFMKRGTVIGKVGAIVGKAVGA